MTDSFEASRRRLLRGALAGAGVGVLTGCDALSRKPGFVDLLERAEPLSQSVQRFLSGDRLAREFPASMISPVFRPNGSVDPQTPEYLALKADDFAGFRLQLRGLVEQPLEFGLDAIRAMPTRTQITRHDCVEGWSVIGQWSGVPLAHLLRLARLKPGARYVVFHCFDDYGNNGGRYYESIDLNDAFHPQTLVAHTLNSAPLPIANGAPLRMRIERKLGYKQPKYLRTIEVVDSYAALQGGKGGYWEDRDYDWYGGI
ncbi:DMSO/TMAO reductase YedYZ molybdopterin-dependent catalytic subunit [Luteimonas cucumeris]|uniref:DMSO/TMAO reductase YedYZ molybdopterin-dependent catalytic subunit n=1 Tax=Luteimonas cucumeris TaxID=985012 RepID=A0A562LAZ7_9GAMM|nr:molybdopterin-dependent oxidoreductase [Luteimonas cucumeris]TWI04725.1 DMSO/TMAO reductase YedYZ molybdopterin-dependent catalytic subunit [Luteimonas cucumeris]